MDANEIDDFLKRTQAKKEKEMREEHKTLKMILLER